jgi:hypothetical protein
LKSTSDTSLVEMYLVCRFGMRKIVEVVSFLCSSTCLPRSSTNPKVANIIGTSTEEAANRSELLKQVQVLGGDVSPPHGSKVLTPPTSICLDCQQQLVMHHAKSEVRVYMSKGLVNGEKWSLRCNGCQCTYSYSKYGNRTSGWKLYPNQRPLVESSDCCFLDRDVYDFVEVKF